MIAAGSFHDYLQLLHPVTAADWELLSAGLSTRTVKEGTVLLAEGKVAKEIFFISKGVLRLVKHSEEGEDITLFFLKEYRCATVLDSYSQQTPAAYRLEAACEAELTVMHREQLLWLYEKIPYLQSLITTINQRVLMEKIETRNEYTGLDATQRYRHFMQQEPDIAARVPLSTIASFLGITQQSLSRIRKNYTA
ncbi:Crp/Fnr family transcriptional regulator [Chitinophaga sp. RAB17]|uniref:Crp/Fnr family transcriptional regulator n=1 Tax=Chitinophaga sp. RAB17 TaxID=3233049 RepID=UPI003F938479